ncbi:hypothetical protein E5720_11390 [Rhodococcus sp. PAMC28707]|uniref:hypothetical protein n=1 Tax=unclassified Rhodococcus (in: high G+C Gram-positive bacteria) TaxID=192944 RepID=UPI00109D9AE4|nr:MULTISPECIES: hypothetical protein [unclassified Rhodococcus (in: high G+C Gram-positive bacteria)]QCB49296.1 hypothetical protein E5769_02625 [Rhodococcus sp. PAMC28705]QCB59016.1 hypothetical protein E5720_11390 [Rhodococcus sp. PAMC28707]
MSIAAETPRWHAAILTPTLRKQCWGFMIGSSLFALGAVPGFGAWAGASVSNVCFFIGAWFFTSAGFIQLLRSGAVKTKVSGSSDDMVRLEWLAAATQFAGTLLFNVSTTAALKPSSVTQEERLVWSPDAGGSVAFLISGVLVIIAYTHARKFWDPSAADWWSGQINLIGCLAFGVSAVAAFVTPDGATVDSTLANSGTFVGALCFFFASFLVLPMWSRGKNSTT